MVRRAMFSAMRSRCRNGHGTHTTVAKAVVAENLRPHTATGIRRRTASGAERTLVMSRQAVCYSRVAVEQVAAADAAAATMPSSTCARGRVVDELCNPEQHRREKLARRLGGERTLDSLFEPAFHSICSSSGPNQSFFPPAHSTNTSPPNCGPTSITSPAVPLVTSAMSGTLGTLPPFLSCSRPAFNRTRSPG